MKREEDRYLGYLIDPSFQGVKKRFVSLFEDNAVREGHRRYFLLPVEIKTYNFCDSLKNLFRSASKN